jgi:hypothetical protein
MCRQGRTSGSDKPVHSGCPSRINLELDAESNFRVADHPPGTCDEALLRIGRYPTGDGRSRPFFSTPSPVPAQRIGLRRAARRHLQIRARAARKKPSRGRQWVQRKARESRTRSRKIERGRQHTHRVTIWMQCCNDGLYRLGVSRLQQPNRPSIHQTWPLLASAKRSCHAV